MYRASVAGSVSEKTPPVSVTPFLNATLGCDCFATMMVAASSGSWVALSRMVPVTWHVGDLVSCAIVCIVASMVTIRVSAIQRSA